VIGSFLPAGTKVRYDGGGVPEFGIVVHCWIDDEIGGYDCYVAFFGGELPNGQPKTIPYVLRYAAIGLKVVSE
jgi:hypothetical protein